MPFSARKRWKHLFRGRQWPTFTLDKRPGRILAQHFPCGTCVGSDTPVRPTFPFPWCPTNFLAENVVLRENRQDGVRSTTVYVPSDGEAGS